MTVSSETYRKEYTGNGVTTEFAINFYFLADADIKAVLYDTVDKTETVLTLTTHYTLTGAGEAAGGTLTMVTAPDADQTLTIIRDVDYTQETDYEENTTFPADSHEQALDKLTMLGQQLQEQLDRCVRIPVSQTASVETPVPDAGKALQWNDAEDALENSTQTVDDIATSVTAAEAAQTAAEAAEALAEKWAEEVEDTEVEAGKYSALHHSAKAEGFATAAETAQGLAEDAQAAAETAEDNAEIIAAQLMVETAEKEADYTLAVGDERKVVAMNKATAATVTVPTNAVAAFEIGSVVGIYNLAADDVTVEGAATVTVRNAGTVSQYGEASLRKRATNEWVMVGG